MILPPDCPSVGDDLFQVEQEIGTLQILGLVVFVEAGIRSGYDKPGPVGSAFTRACRCRSPGYVPQLEKLPLVSPWSTASAGSETRR
jgi:hypothetical protein